MNTCIELIDEFWCENVGRFRQDLVKKSSPRFFDNQSQENILGVKSEKAFSQRYKIPKDFLFNGNGQGDGGYDFWIRWNGRIFTIDVKGYNNPKNMLLKVSEKHHAADLFVLAKVEGKRVTFLGWEHKLMISICPVSTFGGYSILNHYRPAHLIRPMFQLDVLMSEATEKGDRLPSDGKWRNREKTG